MLLTSIVFMSAIILVYRISESQQQSVVRSKLEELRQKHLNKIVEDYIRTPLQVIVDCIFNFFNEEMYNVIYYVLMIITSYLLYVLNSWAVGSDYEAPLILLINGSSLCAAYFISAWLIPQNASAETNDNGTVLSGGTV